MSNVALLKESRATVLNLAQSIKAELETFEPPVKHHFSDDVYAREMFIPKGTVVVGKIHKHTNMSIMVSGDMTVHTENGPKRLVGYNLVVSPPGTQRAVFANEDSIWISIHATEEKDLVKIEKHFIAQDENEYQQHLLEGKPMIESKT